MKRLNIILAVMAMMLMPATAKAQVTDIATLEALIDNHKALSNKLRDRTTELAAGVVVAEDECAKSDKYTEMAHEVRKRAGTLLSYVTFAGDLVQIMQMMKDVGELEVEVVQTAIDNKLDYPELALEALDVQAKVGEDLARVTLYCYFIASAGTGVTLATQEQRQQFVNIMKNYLQNMRWRLWWFREKCHWARFRQKPRGLEWAAEMWDACEAGSGKVLEEHKAKIKSLFPATGD